MRALLLSIAFGLILFLTACSPPPVSSVDARSKGFDCLFMNPITSLTGDELDPVWSPDGRSAAYVAHYNGNPEIYVADWDPDGGRFALSHNVSNAPEDDFAPVWSPDGRFIAYLNRQEQYTWRPTQIRVVEVASGHQWIAAPGYETRWMLGWVADSTSFVYRQDERFYAYDVIAQETHLLYEAPDGRVIFASVLSPDGAWLLVGTIRAYDNSANYDSAPETQRVQVSTRDAYALADDWMPASMYEWSPDSRLFALARQEGLAILDVASGTRLAVYDVTEREHIQALDWSPDGRLAWALWHDVEPRPYGTIHITEGRAQATRELLTISPPIESIAWSPTQDILALQTYAGLYVADVQSGMFSEVAQGLGRLSRPRWSHDGRLLAASVYGARGNYFYGTLVVEAASSALTFYGSASVRDWSPRDNRLLLMLGQWRAADIYELDFCD